MHLHWFSGRESDTYRWLRIAWGLWTTAILGGCAHYHLGSPEGLPFDSIAIEITGNESSAPQVEALLAQNLVDALLRDGTLRVTSPAHAEATLTVKIANYKRTLAATRSDDTTLARSFGLTLTVEASLIDNYTGKAYFINRRISTEDLAFVDSGLTQAEYQIMPMMARSLAQKIKDEVLSVW